MDGLLWKFKEWHLQYGPQEKHVYIGIVGTDPVSQGTGCGLRLMTLIGQAADQLGLPCYLEAPDYNRKFYEKCGFHLTKEIPKEDIGEFLGDHSVALCLMVRPPKKEKA
ncbi:MAG: hypothetical protein SGILL_007528 [Bacillariaceae sp.]